MERETSSGGIFSDANYGRITSLSGFGSAFYWQAAMFIPLRPGMHVLDLGCGTAFFGLAIAEMIGTGREVHGVDLSPDQLSHARRKTYRSATYFQFYRSSMRPSPAWPFTRYRLRLAVVLSAKLRRC